MNTTPEYKINIDNLTDNRLLTIPPIYDLQVYLFILEIIPNYSFILFSNWY